ncbi:MAG: hypothetical protein ABIF17_02210 [Patescibacteria group bacterium]
MKKNFLTIAALAVMMLAGCAGHFESAGPVRHVTVITADGESLIVSGTLTQTQIFLLERANLSLEEEKTLGRKPGEKTIVNIKIDVDSTGTKTGEKNTPAPTTGTGRAASIAQKAKDKNR